MEVTPHNQITRGIKLETVNLKAVLQAVVERLEQEAADNRQAAKKEADQRETALKGRYQAALQAAQDSELKHAERYGEPFALCDCCGPMMQPQVAFWC